MNATTDPALRLLAMIHHALQDNIQIDDLSFDNDHKSGELIVKLRTGEELVISSANIKEIEPLTV
jgi:hypothetical protein